MEFKGTKGKLSVRVCYYSKPIIKIEDENREMFAVIPFRDNYVHLHGFEMANALLISKAPEMLEMLKKHLGILYDIEMEDSGDNIYVKNLIIETKQLIKEATEI